MRRELFDSIRPVAQPQTIPGPKATPEDEQILYKIPQPEVVYLTRLTPEYRDNGRSKLQLTVSRDDDHRVMPKIRLRPGMRLKITVMPPLKPKKIVPVMETNNAEK